MKHRNPKKNDDWKTPKDLYDTLDAEFHFTFDPCPLFHDISKWDGLKIEWGRSNFVNPPYSRTLKERFVRKAYVESLKGKRVVMLLPVSTSTKIFHEIILPYCEIRFLKGRVKFEGVNSSDIMRWDIGVFAAKTYVGALRDNVLRRTRH